LGLLELAAAIGFDKWKSPAAIARPELAITSSTSARTCGFGTAAAANNGGFSARARQVRDLDAVVTFLSKSRFFFFPRRPLTS